MKPVKQFIQMLSIAVLALSLVTSCEKINDPDEDSGGKTTSSDNSNSKYYTYTVYLRQVIGNPGIRLSPKNYIYTRLHLERKE